MVLILCAVFAVPLQAQPFDHHWQAAMQGGSARLPLFALMVQRPQGAAETVASLQQGQGFGHIAGQGPQRLSSGLSLSPILRYDNNINGGTPGDSILIGGLPFTIPAESRALSGVIWGADVGGSLRYSLSPKTVVDAHLSAGRAQGQGARVETKSGSVCVGQFLGGSEWLDLCLQRDIANRALSQNDQTTASLALT